MKIENWKIGELMGYKPITTFYQDFSIADKFGVDAIQDTYNRVFKEWDHDHCYITELAMVLNWKIWRWHEVNEEYAKLYNSLWLQLDVWCIDNLKDEALEYLLQNDRLAKLSLQFRYIFYQINILLCVKRKTRQFFVLTEELLNWRTN